MSGEMYKIHIREAFRKALLLDDTDDRHREISLVIHARDQGLMVGDRSQIDLYGFGTVREILHSVDGKIFWTELEDLVEPTGLTLDELHELFHQFEEYRIPGTAVVITSTGEGIHLVDNFFALWVLMYHSPWSSEAQSNFRDVSLLAILKSGLADQTRVFKIETDSEGRPVPVEECSLKEFLADHGIPDEEEALRKAYRGPNILGGDDD